MHLGNASLYIVSDGLAWMDGGGHFGLVPKVLWEKVVKADELNRIPMALSCLLVVSEGKRILVDTGFGDKLSPKERQFWSIAGENRLVGDLRRLGFAPENIDIVINTHLHSDHCGGNTIWWFDKVSDRCREVVPTFPRAAYWIQRLEWAEARYPNERTRATYLAENFVPLEERGQVRLLYGDTRVTSEVRCIVTRGHTRAHQSVVIESGGETAIYLGDLASWTILMERLAWVSAFDIGPLETIETKRRIRDWALENNALLIFDHDSRVLMGYLREDKGEYKVEAV